MENDEEEKEIMNKNNQIGKIPLTNKKREILTEILRNVNLTKREIKIALIFCYENIKSAQEIVETIFKFLKDSRNYNSKVIFFDISLIYYFQNFY